MVVVGLGPRKFPVVFCRSRAIWSHRKGDRNVLSNHESIRGVCIQILASQTWIWDSNSVFSMILDDPTAYGFVDATSYGNTGDFWG